MKEKIYYIRLFFAILFILFTFLGFIGVFYQIKLMDIQFISIIQKLICDFSYISLGMMIFIVLITIISGRLYCSTLCPFGILQELISFLCDTKSSYKEINKIKYIICAVTIGSLFGGTSLITSYLDPYTIFGKTISLTIVGVITTILVLFLLSFKNRFFCTTICPVGTMLGLLSKVSFFKIFINKEECINCGLCETKCPSNCINTNELKVDNENCIKCLKCLNVCKKSAIKFGKQPKEKIKFSIKRRNLIWVTTTIIAFGSAVKAGIEIAEKYTKNFIEAILPAGAVNFQRMQNKCLNCNLCVKNCPTKILEEANKQIPFVHINFDKGRKYCKFNCNKCSSICPSGAIKQISLEDKKKTRIAIATISQEKCMNCGLCKPDCPVQAIYYDDNKNTVIDSSKCIGCGKCKKNCNYNAINIFAINEQKII